MNKELSELVERLRGLLAKAAQEADDVRYYSGTSSSYLPHANALANESINALPALLDAIEGKGWQDIASAPRDGDPVLLYKPDERMVGPYTAAGYWGEWPGQGEGWIAVGGKPLGYFSQVTQSRQGDPTHWMPLPAPPAEKEG